MNDKVLVEIYVPAIGQKFDVRIPLYTKMYKVTTMVASALSELSNEKYKARDDSILCDEKTGMIYNVNMEVSELGIENGSKLMLI